MNCGYQDEDKPKNKYIYLLGETKNYNYNIGYTEVKLLAH